MNTEEKQSIFGTTIPSFYKASRIDNRYSFSNPDLIHLDDLKNENIYADYDSTTHIRLMKHFKARSEVTCNDPHISQTWINDTQNEFYIRCYLPKSKISGKYKSDRISQLIIMFNGLDEILNYDLYDALGSQFAMQGFASILLPTPYHLNRRIVNHPASEKAGKPIYHVPSNYAIKDKAMMYYYNFKKSINELEDLIQSILQPVSEDHGFFSSLFNSANLKITLFGFSLGGLRALSSTLILKSTFPQIHSCITWNTGPGLEDANVRNIGANQDNWGDTMEIVKRGIDELLKEGYPKHREFARICKWLYFSKQSAENQGLEKGNNDEFKDLRERLGKLSSICLSIQSASDSIVAVNSFERILPSTGLHRLIVPGVDHVPGEDIKWGNWLSKVGDNIIHFIKGCGEEHFNRLTLEEEIYKLIHISAYYKERVAEYKKSQPKEFSIKHFNALLDEIRNQPTEDSDKDALRLEELYYISKAFYPKFPELVDNIISRKARDERKKNR
jgi:hypothetical protein